MNEKLRNPDMDQLCPEISQHYWYIISAVDGIRFYTLQTIICLNSCEISTEECSYKEKIKCEWLCICV